MMSLKNYLLPLLLAAMVSPVAYAGDIYIWGDCNSWNISDGYKFATQDGETYILNLDKLEGQFQIIDNAGNWTKWASPADRNLVPDFGGVYRLSTTSTKNINWNASGYTASLPYVELVFKRSTGELQVRRQLFLRGSATSWDRLDASTRMTTLDGNYYTLDVPSFPISGETFKVAAYDWSTDNGILRPQEIATPIGVGTWYDLTDKSRSGVGDTEKTVYVEVDASTTYQTWRGFGASDAWSPQFVGEYWTGCRGNIARLLFSQKLGADGQPEGIGLSMWRVNLGAGSREQGEASGISDYRRRQQSFFTDSWTYDWNKCAGQRYFMDQAKNYGVESILFFSNSPLVQMTNNGLALKTPDKDPGYSNLSNQHYDGFADYLATVAKHFHDLGYPIKYISPINEPQWLWDGKNTQGQEGSPYTVWETAHLVRKLNQKLDDKGLYNVGIIMPESAQYNFMYESVSGYAYGETDANGNMTPGRSDLMWLHFNPDKNKYGNADTDYYYLGDLSHVNNTIAGHSYFTDSSWETLRWHRQKLNEKRWITNGTPLEVWQTEWCHMSDSYEDLPDVNAGSGMQLSMEMSRVIHCDITVANVSSWSYWVCMDSDCPVRYTLIHLNRNGSNDLYTEGTYSAARTLWTLGNYSLFIRPDYKRIGLNYIESKDFFATAWLSPNSSRLVIVYTNFGDAKLLDYKPFGMQSEPSKVTTYTTSENKELQALTVAPGDYVKLDKFSVTTVVYDF